MVPNSRGRFLREGLLLVAGALAIPWIAPSPSQAQCGDCEQVVMGFSPSIAPGSPPPGAGGNSTQPGEEWDGTAPPPDAGQGSGDIREFQVLPDFDNDLMTVAIIWNAGLELLYDLDLFVERLDDSGQWSPVGSSTDGQLLGDGEAIEVAEVDAPFPGTYRTRVTNFLSTELDYHGTIGFTSFNGGNGSPSRPRATADRPDIAPGSKLHVMYVVPADGVDQTLDTNGILEDAVESMNLWLEGQADGRRLRLDTWLHGQQERPDISFVRGNRTAAEYADDPDGAFTAITDELEERGWDASPGAKRYLVYYEGPAEDPNICGTAFLPLFGGFAQWSVVFLGADPGCGARDFGTPAVGGGMSEAIALQELVHNEGIAPLQSLHQCWAFTFHICTAAAGAVLTSLDPESADVMFPFVTFPLRDKVLDRDHDDYFEHPFPHRDLSDSPFWEE